MANMKKKVTTGNKGGAYGGKRTSVRKKVRQGDTNKTKHSAKVKKTASTLRKAVKDDGPYKVDKSKDGKTAHFRLKEGRTNRVGGSPNAGRVKTIAKVAKTVVKKAKSLKDLAKKHREVKKFNKTINRPLKDLAKQSKDRKFAKSRGVKPDEVDRFVKNRQGAREHTRKVIKPIRKVGGAVRDVGIGIAAGQGINELRKIYNKKSKSNTKTKKK